MGDWIGGLISGLGGIVGAGIDAASVAKTNEQNLALTHEAWARDDNAAQRRVADLEKAGLNKMLATGQAAGTTSPIPQQPFRGMPNLGELYNQGVLTSAETAARRQTITQSQAQTDLINAQKDKVNSDKAGQDLANTYAAETMKPRIGKTAAEAIIAGKDADYAVNTLDTRIDQAKSQAGLTAQQWAKATQDVVTAMNQALASEEMAQLGIDQAKFNNALTEARTAATNKGIDKTNADIAAMAYAIQASGMNADALKKLNISPMMIDLIMNLVETAGKTIIGITGRR